MPFLHVGEFFVAGLEAAAVGFVTGTGKTISYMVIVEWKRLFPKMILSGDQGLLISSLLFENSNSIGLFLSIFNLGYLPGGDKIVITSA
ncbi:hypothetical protein Zm00014a_007555 [Zea mays]|uniref:Uncharacterized protein n=1 Tax=Zea mays TaxID=4577 RepID=A0A3L6E8E4_MAIZE|nr:hypothetical protein Zm00014a_007555 [Zea mays]